MLEEVWISGDYPADFFNRYYTDEEIGKEFEDEEA